MAEQTPLQMAVLSVTFHKDSNKTTVENRRDCFSFYSRFSSLLTSLELDRKQDAWECARRLVV